MIVKYTSDDTKEWFGTIQLDQKPVVSLFPVQIIGLVPCVPPTDDCKGDPCYPLTVFNGDKSSFLFQWSSDQSGLDDYRLEKLVGENWTEIVTGNPSNTLGSESGTKFTFGSFVDYPIYSGYQIDWEKVFDLFGQGTYRFKAYNSFNPADSPVTPPYYLRDFSKCKDKNNTILIEIKSKGRFRNWRYTAANNTIQEFDLVNFATPWYDSIRLLGNMQEEPTEVEDTFVKYGDYSNRKHLSDEIEVFKMRIFKQTWEIIKRFNHYGLNSELTITDDNTDTMYNWTEKGLIRDGAFEKEEQFLNNRLVYNVVFTLKGRFDLGFKKC